MSTGRHFHHYNLGIVALAGVGAVAVIIRLGGLVAAAFEFWPAARRVLREQA